MGLTCSQNNNLAGRQCRRLRSTTARLASARGCARRGSPTPANARRCRAARARSRRRGWRWHWRSAPAFPPDHAHMRTFRGRRAHMRGGQTRRPPPDACTPHCRALSLMSGSCCRRARRGTSAWRCKAHRAPTRRAPHPPPLPSATAWDCPPRRSLSRAMSLSPCCVYKGVPSLLCLQGGFHPPL